MIACIADQLMEHSVVVTIDSSIPMEETGINEALHRHRNGCHLCKPIEYRLILSEQRPAYLCQDLTIDRRNPCLHKFCTRCCMNLGWCLIGLAAPISSNQKCLRVHGTWTNSLYESEKFF